MKTPPSPVYEFGDFRLDAGKRLVTRRDGAAVALTPRVFETLLYLVEHHDTVLDKERLMEAVWPDSIVEENNLSQNISTLRHVFGESPGSHHYIVTVPGRGYRFVAEVRTREGEGELETVPDEPNVASALVASPLAGSADGKRQVPRLSLAVVALVALGLGSLLFLHSRTRSSAVATTNLSSSTVVISEKSIAVLPFDNLSNDKENSYFGAALQDEILSNLAKIADLKVISRTSAGLYKSGNPRNLREIGQQLGVAYLLEGNVQRAGNRVRVNAQLIDARSDAHLWAQTYDRDIADVFAIQSEIARTIAEQLQAKLAPEEKARLEAKPTDNPGAYLLYLKAREQVRVAASKQDAIDADELYARAIALDPTFALAYARAAMLNSLMYQLGREPERKAKARALAEEALRLTPDLGEAHLALGLCWYRIEKDYSAALKEFSIAGANSPNDPEIPEYSAAVLRRQGRWREAVAGFERAQELDPRHAHPPAAEIYNELRDWPAAAAAYKRMLKIEPDVADGWVGLAWLEIFQNANPSAASGVLDNLPAQIKRPELVMEAKWDVAMLARDFAAAEKLAPDFPPQEFPVREPKIFYEALASFARGDTESARSRLETLRPTHEAGVHDHPDSPRFHAALGMLYAYLGEKENAIRASERAVELCPQSKDAVEGPSYVSNLARTYARTGEADRAIPLIERLLSTPAADGITLAELRLRWEWDPLRSDARFQKILAGPEPKTVYR